MELIGRIFCGVANFFLSGRAKAIGVALLGILISFAFLFFSNAIFNLLTSFNPSFNQYVSEHALRVQIGGWVVCLTPMIIGCYMCLNELAYISYKEARRF